jgi:phospholipid-binding lipoprotein MlaA
MPSAFNRLVRLFACLSLAVSVLGGCATGRDPRDPLEPLNRGVYQFNESVDNAILKPVARGYRFVIPQFIRSSVSNFFANIGDVVVALNNLLQGKFTAAYSDLGRVAINSTLGVLGLFDVASEAGIEKHDEDFGQTLGYWGIQDGPFLMIPFFGPSNARDAVGRVGDYYSDPVTYVESMRTRNWMWGTRIVNRRAELLDASTVLQTAALDPYEFVRDAYLQRRRNLIHDGAPPTDREFMDPAPAPKTSIMPFPTAAYENGPTFTPMTREWRKPIVAAVDSPLPIDPPAAARPAKVQPQAAEQKKPAPQAKAEPAVFANVWRSAAQ